MHNDKVTATGPQKKKKKKKKKKISSLLQTFHYVRATIFFPPSLPCLTSPSGGFAAACRFCLIFLSDHQSEGYFCLNIALSQIFRWDYIFPSVPTAGSVPAVQRKKKQDLSSQIVLSLVLILPRSDSSAWETAGGMSDSHSGSADRYPALCAWACCVFLCVRQGTGEGAEGWWGENAQGSTVSLAETRQRRAGGLHSQTRSVWMCDVMPLNQPVSALTPFPRYASGKICWINLQSHWKKKKKKKKKALQFPLSL